MNSDLLTFETFQMLFAPLLEAKNKNDSTGLLAKMYFDAIMPADPSLSPTMDETWGALVTCIENPSHGLPAAGEIKDLIWGKRKREKEECDRQQRLLQSATSESNTSLDPNEIRRNQTAFMAGIYRHQGDTAFYRRMLEGRAAIWQRLGIKNPQLQNGQDFVVTHEDVLAYVEASPALRRVA